MTLKDAKVEARKQAIKARAAAHNILKDDAPLMLARTVLPVSPTPTRKVVSAFYPYQNEIDARPLLGRLAGEGWTTCLPIVVALDEPLIFRRWAPGAPTVAGRWNIPQPTDDAECVEPDVLLVPMMAFDRQGYRLGYGRGFYDRTLAKLRAQKPVVSIGLAYAGQEVDSVPHDVHDQRLDYVMTEKGWFACV